MQAFSEFNFDLSEFRSHSFGDRLPKHDESSVSCSIARMRETEEVERFRLSLATTLAVVSGRPPKLDQACFVGVQFQGKLVETFPQVFVKLFGIRSVFEAQHNVVGESHHDNVTARVPPSPLIGPQIEHVMQVHIRKYGRDHATNNLAKNGLTFDIVIPRSRLKSIRGQGPDFEVQADKEVTSTPNVEGDVHGRKKRKKRKKDSGAS